MLILAATPIGNLGDASARLIEALERVAVIAAEDTRTTQRLLVGLSVTHRPRLIALHEHNERERAGMLVELATEHDVLVLSDAGMPTVSDPGYAVVSEAARAGVPVTVIPGPSAVTTALAVSGLPTDRFAFEGFLPRKPAQRRAALRALARESRTMVFFESPVRTPDALADIATEFGPDRRVAVCRELTKKHEEVVRASAADAAEWARSGVRGEVCLVVAGAEPAGVAFPDAVTQVLELVRSGTRLKDAASEVAAETGHSSRELYQGALAVRG